MQLDQETSPVLLTEKEAGRLLGFSIRTLQKWRVEGRGPIFVRVSPRSIRYRRDDLESWITESLRTSTSDATVKEARQRSVDSRP